MINHNFDEFTPYFVQTLNNDVITTFLTFGNHQPKKNKYATDIYFTFKSRFS